MNCPQCGKEMAGGLTVTGGDEAFICADCHLTITSYMLRIAALEEAYRQAEQWIKDERERYYNRNDEYGEGLYDGFGNALQLLRGAFKDVIQD